MPRATGLRHVNEVAVSFTLNGKSAAFGAPTSELLVDTLRNRMRLTGTNLGCDHASCGACTVLVNGHPRASCSTFTWQVEGEQVTTVEGVGGTGDLSPVQQAFADTSAFQCGYCTPGLIMTSVALLREHTDPDVETIQEWISSNICRCTGYQMVIEAVQAAAAERAAR